MPCRDPGRESLSRGQTLPGPVATGHVQVHVASAALLPEPACPRVGDCPLHSSEAQPGKPVSPSGRPRAALPVSQW